MNTRFSGPAAALLAGLLLPACGDGADRHFAGITVDTLPDGAVHVRNPATGAWRPGEEWTLVEELRIGQIDGDGPDVFGQIRGIEVDAAGNLNVVDAQAHAVQVFAPEGRHLRTLGREGAGPGELRQPFGALLGPDGNLWVADWNNRYTLFAPGGELAAMHERPIGSWGWNWNAAFADGRLVESAVRPDPDLGGYQPLMVLLDEGLAPVDTVELTRYEPTSLEARTERGAMFVALPFASGGATMLTRDGWLWEGHSSHYRLERRRPGGRVERIVERAARAVPVTAAEKDEALATRSFQQFREMGGRVSTADLPDVKPMYTALFSDDASHLWVRVPSPHGEEGTRLDVFDPEGRYLGQLRTPVALSAAVPPVVRGDALYGVVTDDLDVAYVVRWRIEGRRASRPPPPDTHR